MIYLASTFVGYKITDLGTLKDVGVINGLLIDPYRFVVAGFWIDEYRVRHQETWSLLLTQNLRQIDNQRVIINNLEDLSNPADLPKLKLILKIDYQIPDKKIVSTRQKYLGRAEDFGFNDEDFKINYIVSRPPLYRRFKAKRQRYLRRQIEKVERHLIEINVDPQTQSVSMPTQIPSSG